MLTAEYAAKIKADFGGYAPNAFRCTQRRECPGCCPSLSTATRVADVDLIRESSS